MKYKSRYDYRIRKKDGTYNRIMQQSVTIQSDDEGAVLRTFVVHTDISHLKKSNRMMLSFISLEGGPSYIDVDPIKKLMPSREILTRRETEILGLLSQDRKSVVEGKSVSVRVDLGGRRIIKNKKNKIYKRGSI